MFQVGEIVTGAALQRQYDGYFAHTLREYLAYQPRQKREHKKYKVVKELPNWSNCATNWRRILPAWRKWIFQVCLDKDLIQKRFDTVVKLVQKERLQLPSSNCAYVNYYELEPFLLDFCLSH